ncbi:MAG: methyltransferase [Candidatus Heimdallarchaeota archaeon]|nr:MAG: methyltransferase [Candidatus Heimdallarchaeota archaeon]
MKSSLPVTRFSYETSTLTRLGEILKEYFRRKTVNQEVQSELDSDLLTLLNEDLLQVLVMNGLVQISNERYIWNFLPVYSDNLLLFCDFPRFESVKTYVWLSTKFSGGSWTFARSLPVKKGDHVLDLGTGTGLLALMARLRGGIALGVDINPRAIRLAQLNRDLNSLDSVEFQRRDWNSAKGDQFDLIVSQPPFGFSLGGLGLAFNGGSITGLQTTKEIIQRFNPKDHQILGFFIHVLEDDSHSRFSRLIQEWIRDDSVNIDLQPQYSYPIEVWWQGLLRKQKIDSSFPIPSEFQSYNEVVSYFMYLSK